MAVGNCLEELILMLADLEKHFQSDNIHALKKYCVCNLLCGVCEAGGITIQIQAAIC